MLPSRNERRGPFIGRWRLQVLRRERSTGQAAGVGDV